MGFRSRVRKYLNKKIERYDHKIIKIEPPGDEHSEPLISPENSKTELPEEAQNYLKPDNSRLQDLEMRYASFDQKVTTPLVWTDGTVQPDDLKYFRGDNAYVWQLRGDNMSTMSYVLTSYYVKSADKLGIYEKLEEDGLFGAVTLRVDNKVISRDLLDSIIEINFLERHLNLSNLKDVSVLDIGAGYGRLAHRMTSALPNIKNYLCTDGVAVSTFISEYHLRFRGLEDRTTVIPLDQIEKILSQRSIDLAVNIHSFSECPISAIEWWLSLLAKSRVTHLIIAPNAFKNGGRLMLTKDGQDFGEVIEKYGYKLVAQDPKYSDPAVQEWAVNPTYYYLFQLQS